MEVGNYLVDGGVRDNLGLRLLEGIDREARGKGQNSLPWAGFEPSDNWALDLIIVSDGGQSFEVADGSIGLLAQVSRAIDLASLETGIYRPIMSSAELPIITLSIAAELGLSPDAAIVQSSSRPRSEVRRDIFKVHPPTDSALNRFAQLVPEREAANKALKGYERTKGTGLLNTGDLNQRCREMSNGDTAECLWKTLVDLVLDDIERTSTVFRRSATLDDQYSETDADALVRLGRYFVLLKLDDIEQALAAKARKQ
jgi:hypothetical protein